MARKNSIKRQKNILELGFRYARTIITHLDQTRCPWDAFLPVHADFDLRVPFRIADGVAYHILNCSADLVRNACRETCLDRTHENPTASRACLEVAVDRDLLQQN